MYLGRGEDGRKQQRWVGGFHTKRSAEDALGGALGRISVGQFSDPGRITVGEFLDQWIDGVASGLRASTAASYRMLLVKRVIPRIGRIRLASLTPGRLTKLYATLLAEGGKGSAPLSARSVRYTHTVLGKALGEAVDWGLLARNPTRSAKPPRVVKPEMSVWSTEDAKSFLVTVRDNRLYPLWLVMLTTGMRRAEVAGVISIRQTRVAVDFAVFTSEPRTATSRRPIALDAVTTEALRSHRESQHAERLHAGQLWQDTGFVFVREDGVAYHPERITMMFKRAIRAAGLPMIRLHDLRHTSATLALVAGALCVTTCWWRCGFCHAPPAASRPLRFAARPSCNTWGGQRPGPAGDPRRCKVEHAARELAMLL